MAPVTGLPTPQFFRPSAREANAADARFDGRLVGAGGADFPPSTPLAKVPAFVPARGVTQPGTIVYVNGIRDTLKEQAETLQDIADSTGSRVVGVHNATDGFVNDLFQSFHDKRNRGQNRAAKGLVDVAWRELNEGRPVHIMAHSQGALVAERALKEIIRRLQNQGLSGNALQAKLSQITVETYGGAARSFPDGPRYRHVVNRFDSVPMIFGVRNRFAGRDASVDRFFHARPVPFGCHPMKEVYLPRRQKIVDEWEA